MTEDPRTWMPGVQLVFLSTPFLLMLSAMAMNACVALSRDFDLLIEAIQGNPWFERQKNLWGTASFKSRCYLVWSACGVVIWPKLHVRRGHLDADKMDNLPRGLRRRMIIAIWLGFTGFALMFLAIGAYKLGKN
ncbi:MULTISPECIES: hypothetical protein [Pseudomonas]|uniref:Transmembrane protein n=1 Tax=Pseudomonas wadenswilerensis TaxID=1785161 RepID=A0A380T945_9PSED|nr:MULTISPECIES: hypothetical protein [Pseudomonas]SPO66356.1 conserved protein of unknown function [Pseudomonas sp. JV241A]SUQ66028.1 hypothetical protein CCOS864_05508 [Pseudomonas wadenswilerensis]